MAWQAAPGGTEHLGIVTAPLPEPGPGEVRVRIAAAGLNPVDWKVATSHEMARLFDVDLPGGYGNDLAGVVDTIGEGVTRLAPGDRVFGSARGAAVAEAAVVPTSALSPAPAELSLVHAATLPIAARTAAAAIDALALGPEDTVLLGGAAGGVGVLAVQLARRTGATVVATASERNHDLLRELGAIPVTYGEGLPERVRAATERPITAASDLQGVETAEAAVALGVDPARITAISASPDDLPAGVQRRGGVDADPGALERISELVAAGDLRVEIEQTYPLEETAAAVDRLREGHVRGKLVVVIDPSLR